MRITTTLILLTLITACAPPAPNPAPPSQSSTHPALAELPAGVHDLITRHDTITDPALLETRLQEHRIARQILHERYDATGRFYGEVGAAITEHPEDPDHLAITLSVCDPIYVSENDSPEPGPGFVWAVREGDYVDRPDECGCVVDGAFYAFGERAPYHDGCNTCRCNPGGELGPCTLLACEVAILERFYFDAGASTSISTHAEATLPVLAKLLVRYPELRVRINGHTHPSDGGDPNDRMSLSKARAAHILERLLRLGAPAASLEVEGFGDTLPIVPLTDPDAAEHNRRVDFTILQQP